MDHLCSLIFIWSWKDMYALWMCALNSTKWWWKFRCSSAVRKTQSQKVNVNLAASLLCLNIIFIIGVTKTDNQPACMAVAALIHYFILVSFCWMFVASALQYLRFVKVFDSHVEKLMLKTALPSYGMHLLYWVRI